MCNPMRRQPLAFSLVILLVTALVAGSALGEDPTQNATQATQEEAWDQAKVTELAIELQQTLEEAYERSLSAPPQRTALQQRERDAAQGVIRRARDLSQEYARRMQEGWDRETSNPYFRAVAGEVAHIWDTAGEAKPAESSKPTVERLQRVLDELRTAYDAP
jgi:hypothetical protein